MGAHQPRQPVEPEGGNVNCGDGNDEEGENSGKQGPARSNLIQRFRHSSHFPDAKPRASVAVAVVGDRLAGGFNKGSAVDAARVCFLNPFGDDPLAGGIERGLGVGVKMKNFAA